MSDTDISEKLAQISKPKGTKGKIKHIISSRYLNQIKSFSLDYPSQKSFTIDYRDIEELDYTIADLLVDKPSIMLKSFRTVLGELDTYTHGSEDIFKDVPIHIENYNGLVLNSLKELKSEYEGKLVRFDGLMKMNGRVTPRIYKSVFECTGCMRLYSIDQTNRNKLIEPAVCTECGGRKFRLLEEDTKYIDTQLGKVQQPLEDVQGRSIPKDMELVFENDLVDSVIPGEQVRITGILKVKKKDKANFAFYVEVNNVEILKKEYDDIELTEEDIEEVKRLSEDPDIFDKLSNSLVPSVNGYKPLKDVLTLQLFGGTEVTLPDGDRRRSNIHVLVVGDPGTAKSVMLKNIVKTVPCGIYASGKSSSAAGLTAAAVQDENGGWTLEAGALILGDKGHVCIDEFDKMRSEDRSSLHECLEQETLSFNKAGINATLNARCAVVAAANPKFSKFSLYKSIIEQVNLPPSLLSRFDVIFPITDPPNVDNDRNKGRHVLNIHKNRTVTFDIDKPTFRKYVAYARQNIHPVITNDASDILLDYYVKMRAMVVGDDDPTPITLRQLEGMVRLTEASAKAHLRDEAGIADAERAVGIMKDYLNRVGFDPETGKLDIQRVEGGMSRSWENKLDKVKEVVEELEEEYDKPVKELSRSVLFDKVLDEVTSNEKDAKKLINMVLNPT